MQQPLRPALQRSSWWRGTESLTSTIGSSSDLAVAARATGRWARQGWQIDGGGEWQGAVAAKAPHVNATPFNAHGAAGLGLKPPIHAGTMAGIGHFQVVNCQSRWSQVVLP
jgi:hypothetical protein